MVRMRVREHDQVEPRHTELRERRQHDARAHVRAGRSETAQIAASIDEHCAASRELNEDGVTLTDGEEGDAQLTREVRCGRVRESDAEQSASRHRGTAQSRLRRWPAGA